MILVAWRVKPCTWCWSKCSWHVFIEHGHKPVSSHARLYEFFRLSRTTMSLEAQGIVHSFNSSLCLSWTLCIVISLWNSCKLLLLLTLCSVQTDYLSQVLGVGQHANEVWNQPIWLTRGETLHHKGSLYKINEFWTIRIYIEIYRRLQKNRELQRKHRKLCRI